MDATQGNLSFVPSHWPTQTDMLSWCQDMNGATAAILVMGGVVYLFFGFYIFRYLIMANAAALGGYVGALIGHKCGETVVGAVLGGFISAAVTWPMMKHSIAAVGAILGALAGAAIWNSVGLEQRFAWAGALSGVIFFSMLSFIILRGSIMMYMSLQGAAMLTFGILGLVYKYESVRPSVHSHMMAHHFLLPFSVLVVMICGWLYQHHNHPAAPPAKK